MDSLVIILAKLAGALVITRILLKAVIEIINRKVEGNIFTISAKTIIISTTIVSLIVMPITYFTGGMTSVLGYYLPSMIFWLIYELIKYARSIKDKWLIIYIMLSSILIFVIFNLIFNFFWAPKIDMQCMRYCMNNPDVYACKQNGCTFTREPAFHNFWETSSLYKK